MIRRPGNCASLDPLVTPLVTVFIVLLARNCRSVLCFTPLSWSVDFCSCQLRLQCRFCSVQCALLSFQSVQCIPCTPLSWSGDFLYSCELRCHCFQCVALCCHSVWCIVLRWRSVECLFRCPVAFHFVVVNGAVRSVAVAVHFMF